MMMTCLNDVGQPTVTVTITATLKKNLVTCDTFYSFRYHYYNSTGTVAEDNIYIWYTGLCIRSIWQWPSDAPLTLAVYATYVLLTLDKLHTYNTGRDDTAYMHDIDRYIECTKSMTRVAGVYRHEEMPSTISASIKSMFGKNSVRSLVDQTCSYSFGRAWVIFISKQILMYIFYVYI